MLSFEVKDMSCAHCVSAITQAVEAADPGAQVRIDLAKHRVEVQPVSGDRARLAEAISAAGYSPTKVEVEGELSAPARQDGCCCR